MGCNVGISSKKEAVQRPGSGGTNCFGHGQGLKVSTVTKRFNCPLISPALGAGVLTSALGAAWNLPFRLSISVHALTLIFCVWPQCFGPVSYKKLLAATGVFFKYDSQEEKQNNNGGSWRCKHTVNAAMVLVTFYQTWRVYFADRRAKNSSDSLSWWMFSHFFRLASLRVWFSNWLHCS